MHVMGGIKIMHRQRIIVAIAGFLLATILQITTVYAYNCADLLDIDHISSSDIPAADIAKCIERGGDPPHSWRPRAGAGIIESNTDKIDFNLCAPYKGGCRSSSGIQAVIPSGTPPGSNIPIIDSIPWKEIKESKLPCGAVANLSQMALRALWGNVRFNTNVSSIDQAVQTGVTNASNAALSLINKHADCSNGIFWNLLNTVINLVVSSSHKRFIFDASNSSFLSPLGSLITVPDNASLSIDLSSMGAEFDLPNGGSFIDINGKSITIGRNEIISFKPNGLVVTSSGKRYRVDPKQIVKMVPNGIIRIPEGSWIPIDPNSKLHPIGRITNPPDWIKH